MKPGALPIARRKSWRNYFRRERWYRNRKKGPLLRRRGKFGGLVAGPAVGFTPEQFGNEGVDVGGVALHVLPFGRGETEEKGEVRLAMLDVADVATLGPDGLMQLRAGRGLRRRLDMRRFRVFRLVGLLERSAGMA